MGSAIGQTPAQLSAARTLTAPQERPVPSRRGAEASGDSEGQDGVRAGFGANTVSTAAAALLTLDGNFERAREIVPTVEELRAQLRAARAEAAASARAAQVQAQGAPVADADAPGVAARGDEAQPTVELITDRESETAGLPPPTAFRPAAGPQVRAFVQTGEDLFPPPPPDTARFTPQDTPAFSGAPPSRLNLFA